MGYLHSTSRLRCPRGQTGLAGLVVGCTLALWISAGCGSGTIGDGQLPDAQADAQADARVNPIDASASDAPLPPDATPPPDAPPPPPDCSDLYGGAQGYMLCWDTPTTCAFNATTNGGDCTLLCSLYGGTCVTAYDNVSDPGLECSPVMESGDDCTSPRQTEICVCSRN